MGDPGDVVVRQITTDPWRVLTHINPDRVQVRGRSDTGDLQQMRGVDRTAGDDHLTPGGGLPVHTLLPKRDPRAPLAVEQQPGGNGVGLDLNVLAPLRSGKKGLRGGTASPAQSGHLRVADPLRFGPVKVTTFLEPGLLRRLDEFVGQGQDIAVILDL